MQLTCAVPVDKASDDFIAKLGELGITPIVTSVVIRAVYDGDDEKLADKIIALYEKEPYHDIVSIRPEKRDKKKKKRR